MKRLLVLIALLLALLAPAPAQAHSPTCYFGTVYPYMYLYRTRGPDVGSYSTYLYRYVNLYSQSVHIDVCRFYMA